MSTPKPHTRNIPTPNEQFLSDETTQYRLPIIRSSKGCRYIEFYAYDPQRNTLRRKRIKVNKIKNGKGSKQFLQHLIVELSKRLINGWTPWGRQNGEDLSHFESVLEKYTNSITRMFKDGLYRKSTYSNYMCIIQKIREFNAKRTNPIKYIHQMDIRFCDDFLDHIYIELELSAQYRNNCLTHLKAFGKWCVYKGILTSNPAAGIPSLSQKLCTKKRAAIPPNVISEISEYLQRHDKHFLLSCYLLYYCCIRPGEQVRLKISDINIKERTITIPAEASKNKKTQTVTMPNKVLKLMLDLEIFTNPPTYFIFSSNIKPGAKLVSRRMLSKHWDKMKVALHLPPKYQFYSLKDTGITTMLINKVSNIAVRDQARHSSLSITNIYAREIDKSANTEILDFDGGF